MEAKSDAETQLRSRKLPLTRKIYAFYRAPIVKFWSNTVGRLQSRAQARARGRGQPGAVHVYQRRAPGNRLWLLAAGGARAEVDGKKHCGAVTFTSMSGISSHELLPPQQPQAGSQSPRSHLYVPEQHCFSSPTRLQAADIISPTVCMPE